MERPSAGEVEVWTVDLDLPPERVAKLGSVLTEDELLRAAAFKVEHGRRAFVVTRGALRTILGGYLEAEPSTLRFAASTTGKPRLDPPSSPQFNVSHSGGVALIAVAREIEVGVDVEEIKPRAHRDGVAKRVFTRSELEAIDDDRSFYRHWVAKEAFVKATGRGIASVRSFEVLLGAPGGDRLVHVGGDHAEAARWSLTPLEVPSGYAAALVTRGDAVVKQRAFGP